MTRPRSSSSAFTLIELLVVIAIIAILATVVILALNPAELLRQSRDANRLSDLDTLNHALGLYATDVGTGSGTLGNANTVYVSIPDPTASTTAGSNCSSINLPTLPATYTYHCAGPNYYRGTNGNGWIPVNFSIMSTGSPFGQLPVDSINSSSSRNYYTYTTDGSRYEITAAMESQKYKLGGTNDAISSDGGPLASVYEVGSVLGLEPLDYGDSSLVGLWTLDEGTGSTAYDMSGNGNTGTWNGTPVGTSGYYSSGKVGPWAGTFINNYIDTGNNSSSMPKSAGTFSAWVYPTSTYGVFMSNGSVQSDVLGVNLYIGAGKPIFEVCNSSARNSIIGSSGLSLNTWYYLTGTWDGTTVSLYVNGVLIASSTETITPTPAYDLTLGEDGTHWSSYHLNGLLDDARVYNRSLSAAEVSALYRAVK